MEKWWIFAIFSAFFKGNFASMSNLKTLSKEPWNQRNEYNTIPPTTSDNLSHSSPLSCYYCNSIQDGDQYYSISKNNTSLNHPHSTMTKQCSSDQPYCKVYRVEYLVLEDFKAADDGPYTPWSMERNCSNECKDFCVTMGGRTKITYCTSCCRGNFCNTDNLASLTKSDYSILC